jgi:hypothetical protein
MVLYNRGAGPIQLLAPVLVHGLEDLTGGLRSGYTVLLHRLRNIMMATTTNTISATLNKTISMLSMTTTLYLPAFRSPMSKGPG